MAATGGTSGSRRETRAIWEGTHEIHTMDPFMEVEQLPRFTSAIGDQLFGGFNEHEVVE